MVTAALRYEPMPLGRRRDAFDHPEWIFELKFDGFRSLAFVTGVGTKLVSRRGLSPTGVLHGAWLGHRT
jgi:ATP-dependent DNA ligase